jgi:hypothetical protein
MGAAARTAVSDRRPSLDETDSVCAEADAAIISHTSVIHDRPERGDMRR